MKLKITNLLSMGESVRSFRAFSRQNSLFQKPRRLARRVVLVESPSSRANLLGVRLFMGAASQYFGTSFLQYRVAPYSRLLHLKELLRFLFSVERAIGIKSFVSITWKAKDDAFYAKFYESTCGISNPFEFELFEYKGVLVGDLIYDEYLRRSKHKTINFFDPHFQRIFFELISYFEGYLMLLDEYQVEAVVVSNCVYHFAIPLRICCSKKIPAFQVTSESIYRLSKNRLHAYTEFLDYAEIAEKTASEFNEEGIKIKSRIQRRFSGEVGVDMPYSTKSAFSNSHQNSLVTGNSVIKILVATHDFFDSSHSYGFNFYPDFYIWLESLGKISEKTNYEWYLKTHPDPIGDSNSVLKELEARFPKLKMISSETSHHEIINQGINIALTVFGTIGWEYPALGIKTINASINNPHTCFSFSITPTSREEYEKLLLNLESVMDFSIDLTQIEKFYYLHNIKKMQSFIYYDYAKYLRDVGGYGKSTSEHALHYYANYRGENKRNDLQITQSIRTFLNTFDFKFDYRHMI